PGDRCRAPVQAGRGRAHVPGPRRHRRGDHRRRPIQEGLADGRPATLARMKRLAPLVLTALVALTLVAPAWAFNCPVVIKQAEDLIKKAEAKVTADTRGLVDDAKKMVAEAKAHHETAKTKRDHAD